MDGLNRQKQFPPLPSDAPSGQLGNAQYYPPPPPQTQQHQQPPNFSYNTFHQQPSVEGRPATDTGDATHQKPSPFGNILGHDEEKHPEEEYLQDYYAEEEPSLHISQVTYSYPGAPQAGQFVGAMSAQDDVGTFNGGSYRVSHRDTNTLLTIQLAIGCPLIARSGAMMAMSPTVMVKGSINFSVKTVISGAPTLLQSTFTGPGEVLLSTHMLGDITAIRISGDEEWNMGKENFLASTQGITKELKRQGIGKAFFSGEGLFVFNVRGTGMLWITSFGAIIRKDLADGEKYIVDNHHLVAWNTPYTMMRVASGGIISGFSAAEGLVCKFVGPGSVFLQTKNAGSFGGWVIRAAEKANSNLLGHAAKHI